MQLESKWRMEKIKLKNVLFALSLCVSLIFSSSIIYAADNGDIEVDESITDEMISAESENSISSANIHFGKITETNKFFKVTVPSAGKLTVNITGLNSKKRAAVVLYDEGKAQLSTAYTIKYTNPNARYYIRNAGTYYIKLRCTAGYTATASCTYNQLTVQGGLLYTEATEMKKGSKKMDVQGFDLPENTVQYYQITVPSEQTVAIKCTKSGSCSSSDSFCVEIYKSDNLFDPVERGAIFEGQGSGTIYIRNSANYRALPGTYYISIYKLMPRSSFSYSLMWL